MTSRPVADNLHAPGSSPLLRAVPAEAQRLLHVGCGNGELGARLKAFEPARQVFGLEIDPHAAALAAQRLDRVVTADADEAELPLEPDSLDCILYGGVLERCADPAALLRRHRRLLRPGGCFLCYVRNPQHYSLVSALCTGDFPLAPGQPPHAPTRHFLTRPALFKLLLDGGLSPTLIEIVTRPCPPNGGKPSSRSSASTASILSAPAAPSIPTAISSAANDCYPSRTIRPTPATNSITAANRPYRLSAASPTKRR